MRRKIELKLHAWKENMDNRKPLLLYGARQVGKTYTLMKFGEECYENVVYVNLETNLTLASIFAKDIEPKRILNLLEAMTGEKIKPGKTLVFFDEIQACERALTSLKYFCEQASEYHIVAAGSLLGVALQRENFSFPVGKVQSLNMYPFDFEEFLWALGKCALANAIHVAYEAQESLPEALHQEALELYHYYLAVGGMPEAVAEYKKRGRLVLVPDVQHEILRNYLGDMAKYTSDTETIKIQACYNSIPVQLAKENKKFQYKVVQRGGSANLFGASLDWLEQAGIILKCKKTEHGYDPIAVYEDLASFKVYMSDVGLLVAKSGISLQTILLHEGNTFMGAITENYVAQQLISKGYNLFYWAPQNSQAELDFVFESQGEIVAAECKRGVHHKSRSLGIFCKQYAPKRAVRFSEENFYWTENVSAIPLYAAFCI